MIQRSYRFALLCFVMIVASFLGAAEPAKVIEPKPIQILLITGGCCHDYRFQAEAIQLAVAESGREAEWTIINEGGEGTESKIQLYDDPKWAEGFDVIIHNECFADTVDADYIRRITAAHAAGANAVVIHCAMHTYRGTDINDWREFLGVTSRQHDHQSFYPVKLVQGGHPVMAGFPTDHVTAKDELYLIEKVWPKTSVLATSTSERDGSVHPVFWTNQYGKARVFGTTYGHSNDTFQDPVFLRALVRGILWSAGKLK